MLFLFIFACNILIVLSVPFEVPFYDLKQVNQLFEEFIAKYGKMYQHQEEKDKRLQIFIDNLNEINKRNARGGTAVFSVNFYSDLTHEEFQRNKCFNSFVPSENCNIVRDFEHDAPKSIDWVKLGAVTAVKDQDYPDGCGSCYAFSTIGNIEGQYFIKYKKLLEFSVQEIIDCSNSNYGCEGGYMANAINDLIKLGGIQLNSTYPYAAKQQTCRFNKSKVVIQFNNCTYYRVASEEKLRQVVAQRGPISIAVSVSGMLSYRSGILTAEDCPAGSLGHAMLLVGYGTDADGKDYWLVKNSYGPKWGENGYVRFSRGENTCGFFNEYISSADL